MMSGSNFAAYSCDHKNDLSVKWESRLTIQEICTKIIESDLMMASYPKTFILLWSIWIASLTLYR